MVASRVVHPAARRLSKARDTFDTENPVSGTSLPLFACGFMVRGVGTTRDLRMLCFQEQSRPPLASVLHCNAYATGIPKLLSLLCGSCCIRTCLASYCGPYVSCYLGLQLSRAAPPGKVRSAARLALFNCVASPILSLAGQTEDNREWLSIF